MSKHAHARAHAHAHASPFAGLLAALVTLTAACGGTGTTEQAAGGFPGESGTGEPTSSGSGGAGGSGAGGSGAGGESANACAPVPACDAAPPEAMYGPKLPWNHGSPSGFANHRGRDLFVNPGEPQWILAKFAYSVNDNDLEDEQVDIYLLRDCGTEWELLASTLTSDDNFFGNGPNDPAEGIKDDGGRVYFKIPPEKALGVGRHRVHLVVRGDLSATELFIEVVEPGTPVFATDIDGTLSESEYAEFSALLGGELPPVHTDAASLFQILVERGYRPFYLTARPEWLGERTRELLASNGFPPGITHTTVTDTGAIGGSAVTFKTDELAVLTGRGLMPAFAFGNTASDAEAYENTGIEKAGRYFYQFDPDPFGGTQIQSYTELLEGFNALPDVECP